MRFRQGVKDLGPVELVLPWMIWNNSIIVQDMLNIRLVFGGQELRREGTSRHEPERCYSEDDGDEAFLDNVHVSASVNHSHNDKCVPR